MINMVKLPTSKSELFLRVAKGHFATSHSHINYYIDVTTQKSRLSEAKAVAKELVSAYQHSTIVDTVLCLDGTQVIGTCLANELTKDGFTNMNAHKTIYIVTPEYTSGSQIILRDNLAPMVKGKHVLILAASITTGAKKAAARIPQMYRCRHQQNRGGIAGYPQRDQPPLAVRSAAAVPGNGAGL